MFRFSARISGSQLVCASTGLSCYLVTGDYCVISCCCFGRLARIQFYGGPYAGPYVAEVLSLEVVGTLPNGVLLSAMTVSFVSQLGLVSSCRDSRLPWSQRCVVARTKLCFDFKFEALHGTAQFKVP
jgi:hypothetical protein